MDLTNGETPLLGLQAHSPVNLVTTIMFLRSYLTGSLASALLFCIYKAQAEFHNVLAGRLAGI